MSTAKFTPGPWNVLNPDQVRGLKGEFVADCLCHARRKDTDSANAALIAAAPDLLAALEHTFAALEDARPRLGEQHHYADAIHTARAAIARAKGTP